MEAKKREKIEQKLRLLFEQANRTEREARPVRKMFGGVRVIRRRKGSPDLQIA